jgi:hypothetical protein
MLPAVPAVSAASASAPTFMDPAKAGAILVEKVDPKTPLTVADAAAKSGLALRDAEAGLTWLSSEYRGQLRVTADGDLVHLFPTGWSKPWVVRDASKKFRDAIGNGVMGVLRFVVRAWVTIVLVGYAAIFLAIILGLTFANQNSDSRRSDRGLPGGELAYVFLRVLGDALFWTFHPWSPFAYGQGYGYGWDDGYAGAPARQARRASNEPKVPLYERVNRFFFGPSLPPEDPRESERLVLAAIRAGKGRIGLADVMRVTGLPREQADPMMARLMLDYEGDVDVSDDGGIVYRFEKIRRTADDVSSPVAKEPPPAWARVRPAPQLTGNSAGANFAIFALNAFNLLMGGWAIEHGMTIERVTHLFDRVPYHLTDFGTPIVLGLVPMVFSALLFLLPIGRAIAHPAKVRAATQEKGRLAVLREVLERVRSKQPVTDEVLTQAWEKAAGEPPPKKRIDQELVKLGGDVAIEESGATRWRFAELETEAAAVEAEREAASDAEAKLGKVVFATDEN